MRLVCGEPTYSRVEIWECETETTELIYGLISEISTRTALYIRMWWKEGVWRYRERNKSWFLGTLACGSVKILEPLHTYKNRFQVNRMLENLEMSLTIGLDFKFACYASQIKNKKNLRAESNYWTQFQK